MENVNEFDESEVVPRTESTSRQNGEQNSRGDGVNGTMNGMNGMNGERSSWGVNGVNGERRMGCLKKKWWTRAEIDNEH